LKIQNWIACVQDRGKWKEVVEKVKTFNQRKFGARKKKGVRTYRTGSGVEGVGRAGYINLI
jgi:hypothetical protein